MIAFKLAFKNLMGAGLRTWLNVSVLSFAFVIIVFYKGMIDGWDRQARNDAFLRQVVLRDPDEAGTGEILHGRLGNRVDVLRERLAAVGPAKLDGARCDGTV